MSDIVADRTGRLSSPTPEGGPMVRMLAAPIDLNHTGHYLHWGVIQISLANLVVILIMVAVFVAAILVPFGKGRRRP